MGMGNPSVCGYSQIVMMTTQLRTLIIALLPHDIIKLVIEQGSGRVDK